MSRAGAPEPESARKLTKRVGHETFEGGKVFIFLEDAPASDAAVENVVDDTAGSFASGARHAGKGSGQPLTGQEKRTRPAFLLPLFS